MARLSAAVMAHPRRQHWIPGLLEELGDVPVVWDLINHRWDTGRRSLLAHDPGATHHVIVQDDAILCKNFLRHVTRAAAAAGNATLGLYMGQPGLGPTAWRRERACQEALAKGSPWIEGEGPWWAVAIVVPVPLIKDLVTWGDLNERSGRPIDNFDRRISRWFTMKDVPCRYTLPCLVDHRPVKENPSLIPGRTDDRRAYDFTFNPDPDWTRDPIKVDPPGRRNGEERRKMSRTQKVYTRDERGRAVLTEVRHRVVAERNVTVDGPAGVPVRLRAGKPVPFHLTDAYAAAVKERSGSDAKLKKLTINELRKLARSRGLSAGGKKADLVAALTKED